MKEIKLELDDNVFEALSEVFETTDDETKLTTEQFYNLAGKLVLDWITGTKRHRSLTEQYIDWVESIYVNIMPDGAKPTSDVLYNNFNLSPGQAAYIARVLSEKKLSKWRALAKEELKTEITSKSVKAQKLVEKGDKEVKITISISKLAGIELKRLSNIIWENDKTFEIPKNHTGFGDIQNYDISAESIITLKNKINGK